MPKPSARPRIWLPKQIPNSGTPRVEHPCSSSTGRVGGGRVARAVGEEDPVRSRGEQVVARSTVAGSTCTSMPRSAHPRGVMRLMPRSSAATVNRRSAHRRHDVRLGSWRPRRPGRRRPSAAAADPAPAARPGRAPTVEMPTRIAPRSRRCRVSARVSMPLMPTTPWPPARRPASAGRAPVRRAAGRVAHDVAGDPDPAGLGVLVVDAGVADVRRGHHDDLAVVRRVGERLLVAGHAGGEDRLAERLALAP